MLQVAVRKLIYTVLKLPLIALFFAVTSLAIIVFGYLFNFLQAVLI
ncbi:MAG: hypothetical protein JW788_06320 [Candidatus Omnitrophica bacterium]|nr:hypothetical protein [Candidatus Omnitrophota bacterium]